MILGSHHALGVTSTAADAEAFLDRVEARGLGDAAKLVVDAATAADVAAAASAAEVEGATPRVALALGPAGRLSRVLCRRFLPATHESLPAAAAPGQISPSEALEARVAWGALPAKKHRRPSGFGIIS